MPKKVLPHLVTTEDREIQFHFDGPVPRIGEVLEVGGEILLVKAVRWATWVVGQKPTHEDPSENRSMAAMVTCRRLKGYDFTFELVGDGHLPAGWWKKFETRQS